MTKAKKAPSIPLIPSLFHSLRFQLVLIFQRKTNVGIFSRQSKSFCALLHRRARNGPSGAREGLRWECRARIRASGARVDLRRGCRARIRASGARVGLRRGCRARNRPSGAREGLRWECRARIRASGARVDLRRGCRARIRALAHGRVSGGGAVREFGLPAHGRPTPARGR